MTQNEPFKHTVHLQTNFPLEVEIISPTHVGAGQEKNWKKGLDYFLRDGMLYVVDKDALCRKLLIQQGRGGLSAFQEYLDYLAIGDLNRIEKLIDDLDIDLQDMAIISFEDNFSEYRIPEEIKTIIRNGIGNTYLPGSSIKGAIRSAIFHHLYKRIQPREDFRYLNKTLIGDFENSIMRYILPGDIIINNTEISEVELFNLYQQNGFWRSKLKKGGGFPLWIESFKVGAKGLFRLGIAEGFAERVEKKSPNTLPTHLRKILPLQNVQEHLFKIINDYTKLHLSREIEFFERYNQAEDTNLIVENLENYRRMTSEDSNSCLLRLSFGSGFHGMTGDWRFQDHLTTIDYPDNQNKTYSHRTRQKEPSRYKSRKIADSGEWFAPMGLIKLVKK